MADDVEGAFTQAPSGKDRGEENDPMQIGVTTEDRPNDMHDASLLEDTMPTAIVPGLTIEVEEHSDKSSVTTAVETLEPTPLQHASSETTSRSQPPSHHATARSGRATSRTLDVAQTEEEPVNAEVAETQEPVVVRDASAFQTWTSPPVESSGSTSAAAYKIGPFVLLLLDEFCSHYALNDTASMFQRELQDLGVEFPDTDLWLDMYSQCRSILGAKKHGNPAIATTLEQLVDFCVNPQARKAVFSLDMATAHSPLHVCASPKKIPTNGSGGYSLMTAFQQIQSPIVRPSQRPSKDAPTESRSDCITAAPLPVVEETEANNPVEQFRQSASLDSPSRKASIVSLYKNKQKRKGRQHRSQSTTLSHITNNYNPPQVGPGTYGEPVLVEGHKTDLKRDLTSTRLVEKELRHVRMEKILTSPMISTQKKLGFYTLSPDEARTREQLDDPYASALVLEKYGFSKRQECALCQFSFLPYNVPHKVSFKCIMDVYDHWNYVPADRETASKYKAPLCYDAVQVCRMCAQIVFQYAKQPTTAAAVRPLSRKHKKAKSLADLHQTKPAEDTTFLSDPYALPPLLGDDVYDHREEYLQYLNGRRGRRDDPLDGDRPVATESPAKAIVYSQQQADSTPFMTAKEWDVINPEKSSTRHRMEASIQAAIALRDARPPPR